VKTVLVFCSARASSTFARKILALQWVPFKWEDMTALGLQKILPLVPKKLSSVHFSTEPLSPQQSIYLVLSATMAPLIPSQEELDRRRVHYFLDQRV
jgi:hypothetical protein